MRILILLAGFMLLPLGVQANTQVSVVGLFSGKAVLMINGGKPRMLAVGQTSPEGVKLLAADSGRAVLEVEGARRELAMGQGAAVAGSGPTAPTAVLYANHAGHFLADGYINGSPIKFMVDTGASKVVISGNAARSMGISYRNEETGFAQTAAGVVRAFRVKFNAVKIGDITLHQVDGMVLEGASPSMALLGMSALNRMEMVRDGTKLMLTKKY